MPPPEDCARSRHVLSVHILLAVFTLFLLI